MSVKSSLEPVTPGKSTTRPRAPLPRLTRASFPLGASNWSRTVPAGKTRQSRSGIAASRSRASSVSVIDARDYSSSARAGSIPGYENSAAPTNEPSEGAGGMAQMPDPIVRRYSIMRSVATERCTVMNRSGERT